LAYLTIAARRLHPDVSKKIEDKFPININVTKDSREEWNLLNIAFKGGHTEYHEEIFLLEFAETLEDHIATDLQEPLLQAIIRQNYYYFSKQEREKVLYYCKMKNTTTSKKTRQQIKEKLAEYLRGARHLNIEGFIHFRLQFYLVELRKIVESAVDDYLIEKEYQEFIKLLKYFVEIQEPKVLEAHVMVGPDGHFQIRDAKQKLVEQDYEQLNAAYLQDRVDNEDMLVSALVTAAPGRVVIHRQVTLQYPKVTSTLKKIFEGKITFCKNCKDCSTFAKATSHTE
jgi:putative sporulation protein YtxC